VNSPNFSSVARYRSTPCVSAGVLLPIAIKSGAKAFSPIPKSALSPRRGCRTKPETSPQVTLGSLISWPYTPAMYSAKSLIGTGPSTCTFPLLRSYAIAFISVWNDSAFINLSQAFRNKTPQNFVAYGETDIQSHTLRLIPPPHYAPCKPLLTNSFFFIFSPSRSVFYGRMQAAF